MERRNKRNNRPPRMPFIPVAKPCRLCADNIEFIDYKNVQFLQRCLSHYCHIEPPRRSGNCTRHQRMVAKAIKRARELALLPYQL